MPSVVSMPPNISTAALEKISSWLARCPGPAAWPRGPGRPAGGPQHRPGRVRQQRGHRPIPDDRLQTVAEMPERCQSRGHPGAARGTAPAGGASSRDGSDDCVVPGQNRARGRGRGPAPGPRRPPPAARPGRGSGRPARPARIARTRRSASPVTNASSCSCTAAGLNGPVNGRRCRSCWGPSSESMLGPTIRAVEKRGSSTVKAALSRMTCRARSRRVTSQPSRTGTQETGSAARSRASVGCGSSAKVREGDGGAQGILAASPRQGR